jgi:hypothetical protein
MRDISLSVLAESIEYGRCKPFFFNQTPLEFAGFCSNISGTEAAASMSARQQIHTSARACRFPAGGLAGMTVIAP